MPLSAPANERVGASPTSSGSIAVYISNTMDISSFSMNDTAPIPLTSGAFTPVTVMVTVISSLSSTLLASASGMPSGSVALTTTT